MVTNIKPKPGQTFKFCGNKVIVCSEIRKDTLGRSFVNVIHTYRLNDAINQVTSTRQLGIIELCSSGLVNNSIWKLFSEPIVTKVKVGQLYVDLIQEEFFEIAEILDSSIMLRYAFHKVVDCLNFFKKREFVLMRDVEKSCEFCLRDYE